MNKSILRVTALALLAGAVALPMQLRGQTNKPAATKSTSAASGAKETAKAEKKPSAGPFHGKLAALDKTAKTITVGKRKFQITSETKIIKADKPATLEDGVVREEVSGYVKPTEDGQWLASKVTFGPKTANKAAKKSEKAEK